jgi:hypothetical protein
VADKTSIVERALAALDDAFADEIKGHFAAYVGQVAGDGPQSLKGDAVHLRNGLLELHDAYALAHTIIAEVFGDAT